MASARHDLAMQLDWKPDVWVRKLDAVLCKAIQIVGTFPGVNSELLC